MSKINMLFSIVLTSLALLLWSCAGNIPESERMHVLDMNWGKSFDTAASNQILNPYAGENPEPVIGIDGKTAEISIKKYHEEMETKEEVATEIGEIKIK